MEVVQIFLLIEYTYHDLVIKQDNYYIVVDILLQIDDYNFLKFQYFSIGI